MLFGRIVLAKLVTSYAEVRQEFAQNVVAYDTLEHTIAFLWVYSDSVLH